MLDKDNVGYIKTDPLSAAKDQSGLDGMLLQFFQLHLLSLRVILPMFSNEETSWSVVRLCVSCF